MAKFIYQRWRDRVMEILGKSPRDQAHDDSEPLPDQDATGSAFDASQVQWPEAELQWLEDEAIELREPLQFNSIVNSAIRVPGNGSHHNILSHFPGILLGAYPSATQLNEAIKDQLLYGEGWLLGKPRLRLARDGGGEAIWICKGHDIQVAMGTREEAYQAWRREVYRNMRTI